MLQLNKFRIALVLIALVCYFDYHFFGEGMAVREIAPVIRQWAHLIVLLTVIAIGYWSWKQHPMQWLKTIWIISYIAILLFILVIGLLKSQTSLLSRSFLDWVTTIRYIFTSPLPHIFLYMLWKIALVEKSDN